MRKVFPIFLVFIIIGGFVFYYTQFGEIGPQDADYLTKQKYLEMSQSPSELSNFVSEVKENPTQVMNAYLYLRQMIYSVNSKTEKLIYDQAERESLILMQRYLLHEELIKNTPKSTQVLQTEATIEKWMDIGFAFIGYETMPPKYYDASIIPDEYEVKDAVVIQVIFYTNDVETEEYKDTDIYAEYVLVKNMQNQWEIFGWQTTDKFEIVD